MEVHRDGAAKLDSQRTFDQPRAEAAPGRCGNWRAATLHPGEPQAEGIGRVLFSTHADAAAIVEQGAIFNGVGA